MDYTILGATGYIGSELYNRLSEFGERVWAPKRQSREIFERPLGTVFYSIGMTANYSIDPFATVDAHVCYLSELLERADMQHIVYLSSVRLYDQIGTEVAIEDSPLSFSPKDPRHLYDLSKALGENLCLTASGGRGAVARLSSVYDDGKNSLGFLSNLLKRLTCESDITLDSSPNYCRDYITLEDAISALIQIGRKNAIGIYNVASGENTYNYEIASILEEEGFKIKFTKNDERRELAQCNIDRMRNLGVEPIPTKIAFRNICRRLQNEYRT